MSLVVGRTIFVATTSLLCAYAAEVAAANLVTNPEFDANLDGWTNANPAATFTLDGNIAGCIAAPSAHVVTPPGSGTDIISDCIVVDASQRMDFSACALVSAAFTDVHATLVAFSDSTCSSYLGTVEDLYTFGSGIWNEPSAPYFLLPANTQSAHVDMHIGAALDVHFDRIRFGPTGTTPVTLQAFDVE